MILEPQKQEAEPENHPIQAQDTWLPDKPSHVHLRPTQWELIKHSFPKGKPI